MNQSVYGTDEVNEPHVNNNERKPDTSLALSLNQSIVALIKKPLIKSVGYKCIKENTYSLETSVYYP